jgi:hypothetical protein
MTENKVNDTNELKEEIFDNDDFIFTKIIKENGKPEIIGGGYKVNSFFLQNEMSPMTTMNINGIISEQNGGKRSSPFENLAVPAGLFYINQRVSKERPDIDDDKQEKYYKNHNMLPDDIMDKLYGLVEIDKKRKRKTRKQNSKLMNKKTKRRS